GEPHCSAIACFSLLRTTGRVHRSSSDWVGRRCGGRGQRSRCVRCHSTSSAHGSPKSRSDYGTPASDERGGAFEGVSPCTGRSAHFDRTGVCPGSALRPPERTPSSTATPTYGAKTHRHLCL